MKVKSAGMLVVVAGYVWSGQTAAATGKGWGRLCSRRVRSRVVGRRSVGLVSRESGTSDDAAVGVERFRQAWEQRSCWSASNISSSSLRSRFFRSLGPSEVESLTYCL